MLGRAAEVVRQLDAERLAREQRAELRQQDEAAREALEGLTRCGPCWPAQPSPAARV